MYKIILESKLKVVLVNLETNEEIIINKKNPMFCTHRDDYDKSFKTVMLEDGNMICTKCGLKFKVTDYTTSNCWNDQTNKSYK